MTEIISEIILYLLYILCIMFYMLGGLSIFFMTLNTFKFIPNTIIIRIIIILFWPIIFWINIFWILFKFIENGEIN